MSRFLSLMAVSPVSKAHTLERLCIREFCNDTLHFRIDQICIFIFEEYTLHALFFLFLAQFFCE